MAGYSRLLGPNGPLNNQAPYVFQVWLPFPSPPGREAALENLRSWGVQWAIKIPAGDDVYQWA